MQDPVTMQEYNHSQADFSGLAVTTGGIPMSPVAGSDHVQSPQPMSPVSGPLSPVSPMSPGALSPRVVDGLPPRPPLLDSFGKSIGRIQVDIWRRLQINERKWYLWRAVNAAPGLRRKQAALRATSVQPGPYVVCSPAPMLNEHENPKKSRPKTASTPFAIEYPKETPITKTLKISRVIEKPSSKTPNICISPHTDRVSYAKDQWKRRNYLTKSAPARVMSTAPFEKKKEKQLRTPSGKTRINFSELANNWMKDRSVLAKETKWGDVEPCLFNKQPKGLMPKGGKLVLESSEQKLVLSPPIPQTQSDTSGGATPLPPSEDTPQTAEKSPEVSPKSSPSPRPLPPPNSEISRAFSTFPESPPPRNKSKFIQKGGSKLAPRAKTPTTVTKPLFSLTSIEAEEALRAVSPEEKPQEVHEAGPLAKYKSTSSGIKFRDFGPTSSSQKPTSKVRVIGFGRLRSIWNGNKKKKAGKVKLNPGVSQVALLERVKCPQPKQRHLKYHHIATMDPTATSVTQVVSANELEVTNRSSKLEEQGFITAGYVNRLFNRSNNCNKDQPQNVCLATALDSPTGSKANLNVMAKEDEENEMIPTVKKLLANPRNCSSGNSLGLEERVNDELEECISIPSGTLIDNFSDMALSSGNESDSEIEEPSTDFYDSLLNGTYSSIDASIEDVELVETHKDNDNNLDAAVKEMKQIELSGTEDIASNEELELLRLSEIRYSDQHASVYPTKEVETCENNDKKSESYTARVECNGTADILGNCGGASVEQIELSGTKEITSNEANKAWKENELISLRDVTYSDGDASVEPLEQARATGINSPEFENNSSDFEDNKFLYCSESSSDTTGSGISKLLSSDNEKLIGKNESSNRADADIELTKDLQNSLNEKIFDKAKVKLIKFNSDLESESENASNSSFNNSSNMSILSKALKKAGIQFPVRNNSFRIAMKHPLKDMESTRTSNSRQHGNSILELLNEEDELDLTSFSASSIAEASKSSLSILSDFSDDLNDDDHAGFMKTSTPIRHSVNRTSTRPKIPVPKTETKPAELVDESSWEKSSTDEIGGPKLGSECIGNSSEEEEVVEIVYTTTSSSSDEFSEEEEQKTDLSTSETSLNSNRFSQISDIAHLTSSFVSESDANLNNLNFKAMMNPERNFGPKRPNSERTNGNVTWHPKKPPSLSSNGFTNRLSTPKKRKLRRSNARTNLLLRFDDMNDDNDNDDDDDDDASVKNMIKLGSMKSPYGALRPEARNDEIYKVRITPRRRRYSTNPSSSLESQFWAPRHYIEETEKAVYNLLKAEFSSPDGSF